MLHKTFTFTLTQWQKVTAHLGALSLSVLFNMTDILPEMKYKYSVFPTVEQFHWASLKLSGHQVQWQP